MTLEGVRDPWVNGSNVVTGQIPFTDTAKKVLEGSLREALSLGHNYVGTEHIALALFRCGGEGIERLGVSEEKLRNEVIRLLTGEARRTASSMTEHEYLLYRWENERMEFVRRIFFKLPFAQEPTAEDVRAAVAVDDAYVPAGKYRAIPADGYVDITVKAEVVLA